MNPGSGGGWVERASTAFENQRSMPQVGGSPPVSGALSSSINVRSVKQKA